MPADDACARGACDSENARATRHLVRQDDDRRRRAVERYDDATLEYELRTERHRVRAGTVRSVNFVFYTLALVYFVLLACVYYAVLRYIRLGQVDVPRRAALWTVLALVLAAVPVALTVLWKWLRATIASALRSTGNILRVMPERGEVARERVPDRGTLDCVGEWRPTGHLAGDSENKGTLWLFEVVKPAERGGRECTWERYLERLPPGSFGHRGDAVPESALVPA